MPSIHLTDAQINARAIAHARDHRVSYSEALNHVVAFAETPPGASSASAAVTTTAEPLTDAQIDTAAKRYAAQHGVDYLAALRMVLGAQEDAAALQRPQISHSSAVDRQIDAAAKAHASANRVSYAEALQHVTLPHNAASFSEGATLPGPAVSAAVRALQSQPIEIFRAGSHVDNAGNAHAFSVADVKAMATVYNPALQEAPLTLGHPDTDHPAYGWVKGLTATEDGRLLMQAGNVDPAFADGVEARRFKNRSASFYPPHAPANPMPGHWYLRHVGWLGAHPPAIKGLAEVKFGTAAQDFAVCFSDA